MDKKRLVDGTTALAEKAASCYKKSSLRSGLKMCAAGRCLHSCQLRLRGSTQFLCRSEPLLHGADLWQGRMAHG